MLSLKWKRPKAFRKRYHQVARDNHFDVKIFVEGGMHCARRKIHSSWPMLKSLSENRVKIMFLEIGRIFGGKPPVIEGHPPYCIKGKQSHF